MNSKILVSACLLGQKCAFDGKDRKDAGILALSEKHILIPICPEILGGLGCPREKHEITGGTGSEVLEGAAGVISCSGKDRTENFLKGAFESLKVALANNISRAFLKSKSPSCGSKRICSGNFSSTLINGEGVTCALLRKNRIEVFSEEAYWIPSPHLYAANFTKRIKF